MGEIYEAQQAILKRILSAGGQARSEITKGIPYKKSALKHLLSQGKLKRENGLLILMEEDKQQIQSTLEHTTLLQEKQRENKEKILMKWDHILADHEGLISLAEVHRLLSDSEVKILLKQSSTLSISSRALNLNEQIWLFQGDSKQALSKAKRQAKKIILQKWIDLVPQFIKKLGIELTLDLNHPRLTSSIIKKAMAIHAQSLTKISKELKMNASNLERAILFLCPPTIETPEGTIVFSIAFFQKNLDQVLDYYLLTTTHLAAFLKVTTETIRRRIRKLDITPHSRAYRSSYCYFWKDVKCLFPTPVPDVRDVFAYFETNKKKRSEEKYQQEEKEKQRQQQEIKEERQRLLLFKDQMLAMFPIKVREGNIPQIVFHIGPTNSGKTYTALQYLKKAETGIYLAPLRLLAWEIFEKLNQEGIPCSLVTGEEVILKPEAKFYSATVEMMPQKFLDVVVLDESQMATDEERGWAWTRVFNSVYTKELHICCAPEAERLLKNFVNRLGYQEIQTRHYERLLPLKVAEDPWNLERPPESTIFVVFSRLGALALKNFFENKGIATAIIYGALPPNVRRSQAERFLRGEAKICVATDAIGMGMNLPAKKVCFTALEKFDGHRHRSLRPLEVRQIAGRAGRFGLQDCGEVGAISKELLGELQKLMTAEDQFPQKVRIAPTSIELEILDGTLAKRLRMWLKMDAIPEEYRQWIKACNLETRLDLASQIPYEWEEKLGLLRCFTLINAPVAEQGQPYWLNCVKNIKSGEFLEPPLFPLRDTQMRGNVHELSLLEDYVKNTEIFLWLGNRTDELSHCVLAEDHQHVLEMKQMASIQIDAILQKKISGSIKVCRECRKELPPLYSYGLCKACYSKRSESYFDPWEEEDE